jgi:hypothetical protein
MLHTAAYGCIEAPRETASPTAQRGAKSGRGRDIFRRSFALAGNLYREMTHRRQSIHEYADVERRQGARHRLAEQMNSKKEEAVVVSLLGIILWKQFALHGSIFPASILLFIPRRSAD